MQLKAEAQRYCDLIEDAESRGEEAFVAELATALAAVVAEATCLPEVTPSSKDLAGRPTDEQRKNRIAAVSQALSDSDSYWTTLAPFGDDAADAVELPLADDLVDIWRDLKTGLAGIEQGHSEADILWEWRFGFYTHWGRHATEAQRALHARLAESGGPHESSA